MTSNSLSNNPSVVLAVGYLTLFLLPVESKLSLIKECGELTCKETQYCSKIDMSCRNCADTCDSQSNNYDLKVCEKECQDFLHDLLYKRKSTDPDSMDEIQRMTLHKESLEEDLHTMKLMLGMVLISLALIFVLISIILVCLLKDHKQFCDSPKTVHNDFPIIYNKHCQKDDAPISIPLETKNEINRRPESKVFRSPSNSSKIDQFSLRQQSFTQEKLQREPSESTLPEYAYDNPTLVPSPTHHM